MAGRSPKTTAERWIETATWTLIEEGIAAVKIDRLASRLGVTRGGFYHNFKDRDELLAGLLTHWENTCKFLPTDLPDSGAHEAVTWFEGAVDRLILADGYDSQFDLAVREWARGDLRAARAIERADRQRLGIMRRFFRLVGYNASEAEIRSCVLYYHQIGYFALGVREDIQTRKRNLSTFLEILCGPGILAQAKQAAIVDRIGS